LEPVNSPSLHVTIWRLAGHPTSCRDTGRAGNGV
jgi:hypothetical protein